MKNHLLTIVTGVLFALLFAVCFVAFSAHAQTYSNYYSYTAPTTSLTGIFYRDLMVGSSGSDVTALQTFLESRGFLVMPYGVAKGYFGNLTKNAVARYQASVSIYPAAGYFDWATRSRVSSEYSGTTYPIYPTYPTYPTTPTTVAPYVRVINPNGGQLFRVGDTVDIRWESPASNNRSFNVCLINDRGDCYRSLGNTPGDSYTTQYNRQWYVDSSVTPGVYRIAVTSFDGSSYCANNYNSGYNYYNCNNYNYNYNQNYYPGGIADVSDNTFTILTSSGGFGSQISPDTLPDGYVNNYYSQTLHSNGFASYYSGCYPYYNNCNNSYNPNYRGDNLSWRVTSGSLPPGIGLNSSYSDAIISGRPQTTGTYYFTIEVTDGYQSTSKAYSIMVR